MRAREKLNLSFVLVVTDVKRFEVILGRFLMYNVLEVSFGKFSVDGPIQETVPSVELRLFDVMSIAGHARAI